MPVEDAQGWAREVLAREILRIWLSDSEQSAETIWDDAFNGLADDHYEPVRDLIKDLVPPGALADEAEVNAAYEMLRNYEDDEEDDY